MAHVHGAKAAAAAPKMAGKVAGSMGGMGTMMGSGAMEGGRMGSMMAGMSREGGHMGAMMGGGMEAGNMGKMMAGMGGGHMMANLPAAKGTGMAAKAAAGGAAVSAASASGKRGLSRLLTNPWVLFGLGFAAGFLVYKYRREIIAAAAPITGIGGTGFAEPENLEELVAECGECAEESRDTVKPKSPKGG